MPQVAQKKLMDVVDALIALNTNGISSLTELSVRMSEVADRQKPESWRRQLSRWKNDHAAEEDIAVIARAFKVKRSVLPPEAEKPTPARRLAALEAAMNEVGAQLDALGQRLDVLEKQSPPKTAQGKTRPA